MNVSGALRSLKTPVLWRILPWLFLSVSLIQLCGLFPLVRNYRMVLYAAQVDNTKARIDAALALQSLTHEAVSLQAVSEAVGSSVKGLALYAANGAGLGRHGRSLDWQAPAQDGPQFSRLDARTLRAQWEMSSGADKYVVVAAIDVSNAADQVQNFIQTAALLTVPSALVATAAGAALLLFVVVMPLRRLRDELLGRIETDRESIATEEDGYDELAQVRTLVGKLDEARAAALAAERKADLANRAKDEFLANMSHELRTPLGSIISYADLISETSAAGDAQLRKDLAKIRGAASHVSDLVSEILTFSKLEAGRAQLEVTTFDVRVLVDETVFVLEEPLRQNENHFTLDMPDELTMHSDALKVRQILINLLGNAAKFTHKGQITLRVRREAATDGGWLSFVVSDTGIGMTDEQLSKVFEPFVQADGSTTRLYGGTGLGLSIAQGLCAALGGSIEAKSRLGEGSSFLVRLPTH